MMNNFLWIYWNPSPEAFTIPGMERAVNWYGILFAIGFFISYLLFIHLLQNEILSSPIWKATASERYKEDSALEAAKKFSHFLSEKLLWFIVLGTVIGARLGQVFFYDWDYFSQEPLEIFKIWKGGLASHGGVIGVLIALGFYFLTIKKELKNFSFLKLLDLVAIPSALVASFIRLGNFINQEIVGTPTDLPWAVVFGHASDGSLPIPRHPVQLYEAVAYFILFVFLLLLSQTSFRLKEGMFIGLLFALSFSLRFVIEFLKVEQHSPFGLGFLQAGQTLSIPFILAGCSLCLYAMKKREIKTVNK